MKKLVPLAAALAALAFLPSSVEASFSARFSIGAGIIRTGDLSDGIRGYNELLSSLYGSDLRGKQEAPGLGIESSAEFVFHLGRRWGIGLGFGYSTYSRASELSYAVADAAVTESLTAGITAIPLQLNVHLFIPLSGRVEIDAWAGPGVTFARLKWDYAMTVDLDGQDGTDSFAFKADRPAFGAQAGIGVAWRLSSAVDLTAEISGRLVSADGFKGSWTETGSGDFWAVDDAGEASVWAFDWIYGSKPYRQISFQESKPAGANVNNAGPARIGLTGASFKIGLRVRLPFAGRDKAGR